MTEPFIDVSAPRSPQGVRSRIARGFSRLLRFGADTVFARGGRAADPAIGADEAQHGDGNRSPANDLAGLPAAATAPGSKHLALEPVWKAIWPS